MTSFVDQYDILYDYIKRSVRQGNVNDFKGLFNTLNYDFDIDDYSFNGGLTREFDYEDPFLPKINDMSVDDLELIYSKSKKQSNEEEKNNSDSDDKIKHSESIKHKKQLNEESSDDEESSEDEELGEDEINEYYTSFKGGKSANSIIDDLKHE